MGRSGALLLAAEIVLVPAFGALAQDTATPAFWDGFYFGILGGTAAAPAGATGAGGPAGVVAEAGRLVNETFYSGAEAFLAAKGLNGAEPFLWLAGDGRLGARVTETMLLSGSGSGEDADQRQLALNGGAGAELLLAERVAVAGPTGLVGVVFKIE